MAPNVQCASTLAQFQGLLDEAKSQGGLVMVDFFAPHCAACKTMYPKMRQIADRNPEVMFLKVGLALG